MKNFLKQFYWVILGIFLLGVVFSAPALKQWNNSKFELSQYRMLFTDTGLPNGTPVMDINSWWSNISHWPLLDWELNPYITWYSETDPVFNSWLLTPPNVSTFVNDAGYSNIDVQTNNFPVWVPWWLTWSMLWKVWNDSLWVYNTTLTTDSFHSFAFWRESHIDWTWTFAMWLWTKAINDDMVVMGRFNDWLVWTILEIGKWTSHIDRQNALTILDNGNVWIGTTWPANILEINWEASYTNTWDMGTDDTDFASKWYVDTSLTYYVPRTAVDTGFNNTGSDTIIPSEKAVWSLVSWLNNDYIPYWDGSKFINSSISHSNNMVIGVDDSSCSPVAPNLYSCDIWQVCPDDASVCSCEGAGSDVYAWDICTFHGAGTWSTTTIGSWLMFYSSDSFLVSALKYEFKIAQNPIYDVAKFFQHKWYFGWVKKCMYNSGINAYECDKWAICEETQCICDTLFGFISYGEICSKTPDVDFSVINTWWSHVSISDWWVIFNGEWRLWMSWNNFVIQAYTGWVWVEKESFSND